MRRLAIIETVWYLASLVLVFVVASVGSSAVAQERHDHGDVDWYDFSCCSNNDCKVASDSDVEFFEDKDYGAAARHKPTGSVFIRPKFRVSRDGRFHVCINANLLPVCIYIPPGA